MVDFPSLMRPINSYIVIIETSLVFTKTHYIITMQCNVQLMKLKIFFLPPPTSNIITKQGKT